MTPAGVILHGSRSGHPQETLAEFHGTVNFAQDGAPFKNPNGSIDFLGWNATIGPGVVADHIDPKHWGWNARQFSQDYLAVEFAQPNENDPIDDTAIDAFAWWFLNVARGTWPDLPTEFPTHAELDVQLRDPDGKTDVFIHGAEIRARIMTRLGT